MQLLFIFSSFSLHVSVTIDHPQVFSSESLLCDGLCVILIFTKKKCNRMLKYRNAISSLILAKFVDLLLKWCSALYCTYGFQNVWNSVYQRTMKWQEVGEHCIMRSFINRTLLQV
jgi:hypothetical protein